MGVWRLQRERECRWWQTFHPVVIFRSTVFICGGKSATAARTTKSFQPLTHRPTARSEGHRWKCEPLQCGSMQQNVWLLYNAGKKSHLKISRGDLCKNMFFYSNVNVTVFFSAPLRLGASYTLVFLYVTVSVPIWTVFQHCTEFRNSRILLLCVWPAGMSRERGKLFREYPDPRKKTREPGGLRVICFVGANQPTPHPQGSLPHFCRLPKTTQWMCLWSGAAVIKPHNCLMMRFMRLSQCSLKAPDSGW